MQQSFIYVILYCRLKIFSFEGELLDVYKMNEKAWHLNSNNGKMILGLGRPRNGILTLKKDKISRLYRLSDSVDPRHALLWDKKAADGGPPRSPHPMN